MKTREDLLLIGRLFGAPNSQLKEIFNLTQIDDFSQTGKVSQEYTKSLRAAAVGMVGSGHVSTVEVNDAFFDIFCNLS